MGQLLLFGSSESATPIARRSDPVTSHMAAAETETKLKKHKAYCVAVMTGKLDPRTAQEIALEASQRFGGITDTYRKRPHELVNDKVFVECGFRKCTVTSKQAQTFLLKVSK